jgi:hypothetical protein
MNTSTAGRPRNASIAAAGVAAGGPTIVIRAPGGRVRGLEQLADQLHGEVLERQRRPVEQLQQEMRWRQLLQGRAGGWPNPA